MALRTATILSETIKSIQRDVRVTVVQLFFHVGEKSHGNSQLQDTVEQFSWNGPTKIIKSNHPTTSGLIVQACFWWCCPSASWTLTGMGLLPPCQQACSIIEQPSGQLPWGGLPAWWRKPCEKPLPARPIFPYCCNEESKSHIQKPDIPAEAMNVF